MFKDENRPDFLKYFDERYIARGSQEEALEFTSENWQTSKAIGLNAACAVGKSLIAKTVLDWGAAHGITGVYITPQKMLQDQLENEFCEINILKGKNNYKCKMFPDNPNYNVEMADASQLCEKCPIKHECYYNIRKRRVLEEPYTIFNPMSYYYNSFIGEKSNYNPKIMIIDEAQSVVSMLNRIFEITIWRNEFKYKTGTSQSTVATIDLLTKYHDNLEALYKSAFSSLTIEERIGMQKQIRSIYAIKISIQLQPEIFVVEETIVPFKGMPRECLKIRAVTPSRDVLWNFFNNIEHIIVMSGTLFRSDMEALGLKDYAYKELKSPIDKSRRKLIPVCSVNNSYSNESVIDELYNEIVRIAGKHPNERGLILTTYDQAAKLKLLLQDNPRYIFHTQKTKKKTIDKFMTGKGDNTIAVLSGTWEGLDAKDDLCRFVIITKCLFPNLKDLVVKRQIERDKEWYTMETMKYVIQGANRATRNEGDFSTVYMLDSNFISLYARTKKNLPESFKEAVMWGEKC